MKRKKKLAIILTLMLAVFMCFDTGSVYAKSLEQLQKEIEQKQQELEEGKEKERNLSQKITGLEQKVFELNDQIVISEKKLDRLEEELEVAKEKVDKQNSDLGGRLRNMYKNGNVGFLDVLMNSGNFSSFLTNLDLVEKIYASDKEVLEDLQEAHDQIEKKKIEVEKLQENLEISRTTAKTEMAKVSEAKKAVAADNEKNHQMLNELEQEAYAVQAELQRQSNSGAISNSNTSTYTGGIFAWPVPSSSTISSGYGWRICPFHGKEFHGAIDIAASSGSPIVASASGTVISAGWNGGFGNSVKIDHGGGMVTMYNHCSSLNVSVGQSVSRGQTVAYIGSTGSSTGPHLDYRVFRNGSTMNPHSYL
ncbi:MAG: peptidoglycan DD-metalloendopeptidase family protein [Eubacteriales bacterium]|nr:peptidoglycan DD-metalloendopeptidase family protein [Eubacteriales bacterium]